MNLITFVFVEWNCTEKMEYDKICISINDVNLCAAWTWCKPRWWPFLTFLRKTREIFRIEEIVL